MMLLLFGGGSGGGRCAALGSSSGGLGLGGVWVELVVPLVARPRPLPLHPLQIGRRALHGPLLRRP
jgi:hypothetical protein